MEKQEYNPNFALLDYQNEYFSEENYEVSDQAYELLKGAIDTHVHSNPTRDDGFVLDDFELVREYEEAGLDGVVIKCHEFGTFSAQRLLRSMLLRAISSRFTAQFV